MYKLFVGEFELDALTGLPVIDPITGDPLRAIPPTSSYTASTVLLETCITESEYFCEYNAPEKQINLDDTLNFNGYQFGSNNISTVIYPTQIFSNINFTRQISKKYILTNINNLQTINPLIEFTRQINKQNIYVKKVNLQRNINDENQFSRQIFNKATSIVTLQRGKHHVNKPRDNIFWLQRNVKKDNSYEYNSNKKINKNGKYTEILGYYYLFGFETIENYGQINIAQFELDSLSGEKLIDPITGDPKRSDPPYISFETSSILLDNELNDFEGEFKTINLQKDLSVEPLEVVELYNTRAKIINSNIYRYWTRKIDNTESPFDSQKNSSETVGQIYKQV